MRDNGVNALLIFDDMEKHANAYREANLLMRNPSGREAFPGDVFFLHSKLLERAAQLSFKKGYGSLTALPVMETKGDTLDTYIATNLISITDGQWFLSSRLEQQGWFPAIDIEKSVSRIGKKAQPALMS